MKYLLALLFPGIQFCTNSGPALYSEATAHFPTGEDSFRVMEFREGSWQRFLTELPLRSGSVVDYTGKSVADQQKAFAIVDYDIGSRDLQQCADALIRLRAEYLFSRKRYDEIGFHFTNGIFYSWKMFRQGLHPVVRGNQVELKFRRTADTSHASLRQYLDIVYTYAGTISLARELKPADKMEVGTVIITPGSPGHCMIITGEAHTSGGRRMFMLAESFMPAQSIYILRSPGNPGSPWHDLSTRPLQTRSFHFQSFRLCKFE